MIQTNTNTHTSVHVHTKYADSHISSTNYYETTGEEEQFSHALIFTVRNIYILYTFECTKNDDDDVSSVYLSVYSYS